MQVRISASSKAFSRINIEFLKELIYLVAGKVRLLTNKFPGLYNLPGHWRWWLIIFVQTRARVKSGFVTLGYGPVVLYE